MNTQEIIISMTVVFLLGLLGGYEYTVSHVTSTKSDSKSVSNDVDHKVTTITEKPSGDKTTTIVEDDHSTKVINKDSSQVVIPRPKWNVSGLVALDSFKDLTPKYGISVSKEYIGLRVGIFGLTNGTAGVSLGLDF